MVAGLIYSRQWEALDRYRVTFRRRSNDGRAVHPSAPARTALRLRATATTAAAAAGASVRVDDCQR